MYIPPFILQVPEFAIDFCEENEQLFDTICLKEESQTIDIINKIIGFGDIFGFGDICGCGVNSSFWQNSDDDSLNGDGFGNGCGLTGWEKGSGYGFGSGRIL